MTEDEAKQKWCPFVRGCSATSAGVDFKAAVGQAAINRVFLPDGPDKALGPCIGSACMAWRATNYPGRDGYPKAGGYCGLAGAPQ